MARFTFLINLIASCSLSTVLIGCMSTTLRSMATQPIPTAHQPRINPDSKDSEIDLSIEGFGTINHTWFNTQDINAGGGVLEFNYSPGGKISPLFIGTDLSIYAGSVQFDCERTSHCSDSYRAWLTSETGQEKYTFWSISEKIAAGAEIHLPANLFLGIDGGIRLFQGGGSYDDKRQELDHKIPSVKNLDDGNGVAPVADFWLGYHFGNQGRYGATTLQGSWSTLYQDEQETKIPITLSYFHPSGFHGGISWVGNTDFSIYLGKTFSF